RSKRDWSSDVCSSDLRFRTHAARLCSGCFPVYYSAKPCRESTEIFGIRPGLTFFARGITIPSESSGRRKIPGTPRPGKSGWRKIDRKSVVEGKGVGGR